MLNSTNIHSVDSFTLISIPVVCLSAFIVSPFRIYVRLVPSSSLKDPDLQLNDREWQSICRPPLRRCGTRKALDQDPRAHNPFKRNIWNVEEERNFVLAYHEHSRNQYH